MVTFYNNCCISITSTQGEVSYSITFGLATICQAVATTEQEALKAAKLFIDRFVAELPPALSYKY